MAEEKTQAKGRGMRIFLIVLVILIILAAAAAGIYFGVIKKDDEIPEKAAAAAETAESRSGTRATAAEEQALRDAVARLKTLTPEQRSAEALVATQGRGFNNENEMSLYIKAMALGLV